MLGSWEFRATGDVTIGLATKSTDAGACTRRHGPAVHNGTDLVAGAGYAQDMKRLLVLSLAAVVAGCGASGTVQAVDREVTIPFGTTLPLVLTNSIASDRSAVEDPVTAELKHSITIDGVDVLPAGTQFTGIVTEVDTSGRITGRAMIRFRLNTLHTRNTRYYVQTASLSHLAETTKREDASKAGIATGGQEVRLEPGADVTTRLTVPLTVRVPTS